MPILLSFATAVRRIAGLALTGFLVVTLAGPFFAVVSALFSVTVALVGAILPLVLVGYLAWTIYQMVFVETAGTWHRSRAFGSGFVRIVYVPTCFVATNAYTFTRDWCRGVGRLLGAVFVEASCGAGVGALLGLVEVLHGGKTLMILRGSTVVGAVLGAAVGLSRGRASHAVQIN